MRSAHKRSAGTLPGAAQGGYLLAVRSGGWRCLLLALGFAVSPRLLAQPHEWTAWSFVAASHHADAAVFTRASQRLAVRRGERIADSPWVLVSINGDQIWLSATESQSQRELLRPLGPGQPLPELPDAGQLGVDAVEVPVIDVSAGANPP